ncbi:YadA-like family protein, partial [Acinetobacter brisouii]|uniref:YadA-like family protein n=1 Tax=Acinetobacter brisouii TaxID=396323 RepID=UPI000AF4F766
STGIDAANTRITNVAAGTHDTDAVNVAQINQLLGVNINGSGAGGAVTNAYNIDGYNAVNTQSAQTDLNGTKLSAAKDNTGAESVSGAISALNTEVKKLQETNLGTKYFRVNSSSDDSLATGQDSIAIGTQSRAVGDQSIAIGVGNIVNGKNSGAIGDPTIINGNNSYSVGNNNTLSADDTFVLGNNVTKTVAGSVVLGTNSAATTGAGVSGYASSLASTADIAAINATTSTTGAVAVGDASNGVYRQITGVAAGTQNSDAVNVAQLKAVDNAVSNTGASVANILGGGASLKADGSISNPTYSVAGTTQTTVSGALNALDQAITTATNTATAGWTLSANGSTQQIKPNGTVKFTGDDNINVALDTSTSNQGDLTVSLKKDLTLDSVTTGNTVINNAGVSIGSNVSLGSTGLVITGGPSVTTSGINAGGTTITNVADGVNAQDAVNKGQLDVVAASVQATDSSAVKYDNSTTKNSITLAGANGTTISNVADGTVAQGSKDAVNGGQLWNVQQQVDQNTSDISQLQQSITNVTSGKAGLVQQATNTDTITVGKDMGGTTVSVAGTEGNRTVTGVKAGTVSSTSTDAVNGSQLYTTNTNVATYLGGGSAVDATTGNVSAPTYSVAGGSYNNVGSALTAVDNRVANVEQNLEKAFTSTNNRINKVEKTLSAGIAATAALENAPYVAGKFTYAAGASAYNGESAIGVTLRRTADNGRWSMSGGVAAGSQGDPLFRVGISGVID